MVRDLPAQPRSALSRRDLLRRCVALSAGLAVAPLVAACGATASSTSATTSAGSKAAGSTSAAQASSAGSAARAAGPAATPTPVFAHRDPVGGKGVVLEHWQNWSGYDTLVALGKVFDVFQKDHPDIGLNAQGYNQDKFVAQVAAGTSPDSVTIRYVAPNAQKGLYQALDDRISKSAVIKKDDFTDAQFKQVQWKGKTWGVPALENGPRAALVYNKQLWQAAGLDPAKPPTTWDDMADYAQKLTKYSGDQIDQLGFDPLSSMGHEGYLDVYGEGYGTHWYDYSTDTLHLNDQGLIDATDWIAQPSKEIRFARWQTFRKTYGEWDGKKSGFDNGKEAMIIQGDWTPGGVKQNGPSVSQNIGTAFFPTKINQKLMLTGGWSLQIPTGSKRADQAFAWFEYLTTVPAIQMWLDGTGLVVYTKSFAKDGKYADIPGLSWFLDAPSKADRNITIPNNPIYDQIDKEYNAGLAKVREGKIAPKDMLDDLQTRMQAALNQALGKS